MLVLTQSVNAGFPLCFWSICHLKGCEKASFCNQSSRKFRKLKTLAAKKHFKVFLSISETQSFRRNLFSFLYRHAFIFSGFIILDFHGTEGKTFISKFV
jgi:hypothetical protein